MKYHFKNIGPIKDASIELGDLTILAGPNNSGKTYIAYTIYGFLAGCSQYLSVGDDSQKIIQKLIDTGHADLDLSLLNFKELFSVAAEEYSRNLHEVFNARKEEFASAAFTIEIDDPLAIIANIKTKERRVQGSYDWGVQIGPWLLTGFWIGFPGTVVRVFTLRHLQGSMAAFGALF
ncbi:MAG: AAA family ATPase, partial [Magnetococcales bacterium]|nr:AAA family ATPase [Magnetococcales bacterium]